MLRPPFQEGVRGRRLGERPPLRGVSREGLPRAALDQHLLLLDERPLRVLDLDLDGSCGRVHRALRRGAGQLRHRLCCHLQRLAVVEV